jgi:hypothetical protein
MSVTWRPKEISPMSAILYVDIGCALRREKRGTFITSEQGSLIL